MEFIDTTGHVFSIESYDDEPINIKYKEGDYVFWVADNDISINNYYIKPIRFIIPVNDINENISDVTVEDDPFVLNISVDSNFFKLLSMKTIQEKLELNKDIKEKIEIYYEEAKSELTLDDFYFKGLEENQRIIVYGNDIPYYLFQFYVIAKSKITGTFLSNIMIRTGNFIEKTAQEKVVWLDKDQMYDYLLRQTMSDIKIYEYDQSTGGKSYFHTIKTGYSDANEIITRNDDDYKYRIRNWGGGIMNPNVYHYIYRIPKEKWLLKDHWYVFEGKMYETCHYCGSIVYGNHDGYGTINDGAYNNPTANSLIDVRTGNPFYPEDYDYDDSTNTWIPKDQSEQTKICEIGRNTEFITSHRNGNPCEFNNIPVKMTTTVKDIFFDIDNEKVTNNTNGGYITIKKYEYQNTYTQITVGGTFIDECEELVINGRNMGIELPKDIIKAIYQSSFYNKYPDEVLFKDKIKELLLNYMSIKGECGNFKSAVNALKWFGWENKISISQLIKTDNEFQDQYIIDYFNINDDIKDTYKYFTPTNYITLSIKDNQETGNIDVQKYNKLFWGEGQPLVEDLFDKVEEVYKDDLIFYKPYYDFIFSELAIKLDCLRYYYQRYFLPLHLRILRASIDHKVYANDIKMNCYSFEKITSSPINIPSDNIRVEFPETHELLFYKSMHLIDNKFNEFSNYNNDFNNEDLFYINENCVKIPIKFINDNSRYSQNPIGDYVLIGEDYFKIVQFLYYDEENDLYKIAKETNATHYRLSENMDIMPLNSEDRYTKLSSCYFNCDIILTVTTKIQNPKGHYVLIDGEWKYKAKFYNRASTLKNLIEDENGNYIKLYNELVYVNPKDRYDMVTKVLIERNSFNYYQNINQYYVNLVFIPRLMKIYNIDWLNSSYRVSVLCNNKWFNYDFIIKVPNLYLDFGRLSYRYYIKDEYTEFKQIKDINGSQIYFNSFMYQPDLVTIDTLFKEEDADRVLTFIDKVQETRYSRNKNADGPNDPDWYKDNVDLDKMYEFVRKYYRNQIKVPYNKKFYNRIHLFDIYKRNYTFGGTGFDYIIVAEYFGWHTWGDEWSEYNGGKENVIKGWGHLVPDFFQENPNGLIKFYREDGDVIEANSTNLYDNQSWQTLIIDNEYTEKNISHVEFVDDNGNLVYDLKYVEGDFFSDLVLIDDTEDLEDDVHINHMGRRMWWYDSLRENDNCVKLTELGDKLEYDNNPMNIPLYTLFFPQIKDYNFIIDLKEKVPYDVYLMHDKWQGYTDDEVDEHNFKLDIWDSSTIKTSAIHPVYYSNTDEEVINGEKTTEDIKEEGVDPEYYTSEEIEEHNSRLDIWEYGKLKENKKSYWYIVMISKYPIGNYKDEELLDIDLNTEFNVGEYIVKYSGFSLDKFLVNRMDIQKSNGYNHFNIDDLVIVSINNNDYQFNIDLTNKWKIQRIYDPYKFDIVNSNANIMIIPSNNFDQKYSVGYYNVQLDYIIDGINIENHLCKGYYRINKEYEDIDYDKYSYNELFTETDYFVKLNDDSWDEIPETIVEYWDGNEIKVMTLNITGNLNQSKWRVSPITISNVRKIVIGTNVTSLDSGTFNSINTVEGCELYISSTISKITIPLFESASMVTILKVHPDNQWFDSRGNCNAIILTNDDLNREHLIFGQSVYHKNTLVRGCANTFLPNSIEDFADHIFCSVANLKYLDTGNNATYIGNSSLWNLKDLETLILGANIARITSGSITSVPKLKTVYIRAKTPPIHVSGNYELNTAIILNRVDAPPEKIYVEPGCGELYKNHYAWSIYSDIIEEMEGEF